MRPTRSSVFIALFFASCLTGCFKITPPVTSLKEAYQKFVTLCKEEYSLDVKVRQLNDTVYIYLPIDQVIVDIAAKTMLEPQAEAKATVQTDQLKFIESAFAENAFKIDYAVASTKNYPTKDPGYQTAYGEEFKEKQRNILTSIFRAFGDLGIVPGDVEYKDAGRQEKHKTFVDAHLSVDQPPEFVVLVIADIKKGIEIETIFNFSDLKRTMVGELLEDEYQKRTLYELRGGQQIIGDMEGKHLDYKEILWPDFIARQIKNRVSLAYQNKMIEPGNNEDNILKIVAQTIRNYGFKNFSNILLHNLETDAKSSHGREHLKIYLQ